MPSRSKSVAWPEDKPSEALARGRRIVPRNSPLRLLDVDESGLINGACHLGAMSIGMGVAKLVSEDPPVLNPTQHRQYDRDTPAYWWAATWPTTQLPMPCGCFSGKRYDPDIIVAHLSDAHDAGTKLEPYSSEDVIAWLKSNGL